MAGAAPTGERLRLLGFVVFALAALALPLPATAAPVPPQVGKAKQGVAKALAAGKIAPADAARYRGILARAAHALPLLGGARESNLRAVLDDVANKADEFSAPRAEALFGMLDENVRYFGAQGPPKAKSDVVGPDGTVYRYFPGHGLQFHPLADAGALNADLAAGRLDTARQLIAALQARAVDRGDGSVIWEYYFRYAGGRPPWTSGMAQAVMAQALARASQKLDDPSLLDLARRAAAAIPGVLVRQLPAGPWIKLYNFSKAAVLNAQLQSAVALRDYANIANDTATADLADRMTQAAHTELPQFDTGYWSLYQLGGPEESRAYNDYVVFLLNRLKSQTKDSFWSDTAARFKAYDTQPPVFAAAAPSAVAAGAKKGTATLKTTFWLSKASAVSLHVGGSSRTLSLGHGWHTVSWKLARSRPGVFPVTLNAWPVAGPQASTPLLPFVVLARQAVRTAASARRASDGAGSQLVVGAAENAVMSPDAGTASSQLALATNLGLQAIRVAVTWPQGQTTPDPAQLAALQTAAQQAALVGVRIYLELYPSSPDAAPVDASSQAQYAEYLRQLAVALPQVKDFVIGTQVNSSSFWPQGSSSADAYAHLLAASYDALKSVDPANRVIGASLSGQGTPGSWILALGKAYRAMGRATPIMDALALQPWNDTASQPPSFVHAKGTMDIGDYPRLVANLGRAFDGTAQPGSQLPIVYDGYGVQTQIPPEKAGLYTQTENDAVDEATQGSYYAQALLLASCQPTVSALLFQHTVDERDLTGWQSGLYYPDLTPKSDFQAVHDAIASLRAGTLGACPQPSPGSGSSGPAVLTATIDGANATLSCDRACYYVAVLLSDAGVPEAASQGSVKAGVQTQVAVSTAKLQAGSYHLQVHLVPRVDPASAVTQDGEPFTLG